MAASIFYMQAATTDTFGFQTDMSATTSAKCYDYDSGFAYRSPPEPKPIANRRGSGNAVLSCGRREFAGRIIGVKYHDRTTVPGANKGPVPVLKCRAGNERPPRIHQSARPLSAHTMPRIRGAHH